MFSATNLYICDTLTFMFSVIKPSQTMLNVLPFILFLFFSLGSLAQEINYEVPDDYKSDISKEDYKKIVDLSVPIVAKKYAIDNVKDGTITLKKGQDISALNLDNLILRCVQIKNKSTWDKVVQEHFKNLFADIDTQRKINPKNFESVKQYLSVRIYPTETIDNNGGSSLFVWKHDLEGTYTLLMLDLPNSFIPVEKSIADLWGKDEKELFRMALANINKQPMNKQTRAIPFEGNKIEVSFIENENYAASYVLDLWNNTPE